MNPPAPSITTRPRPGFTLVEVVIVVLVLGVLVGVTMPRLMDVSRLAQANAIASHIRVGQDAAARYHAEHGHYPADARHGQFPPELNGYLPTDYFSRSVPGGGSYDWNGDGVYGGVYAGMSIYIGRRAVPTELWLTVDRLNDDGNLRTGNIRAFGTVALQFELEPL